MNYSRQTKNEFDDRLDNTYVHEVPLSNGDLLTLQKLLRECYDTELTLEEVKGWAEERLQFAHRILLWKLQAEQKKQDQS